MALNLKRKKSIVADVVQAVGQCSSVIAADYRGLTVSEITSLRVEARKVGVKLRIVRNTLAKRAFKGTAYECLNDSLKGPVLLAFVQGDEPAVGARLLRDFAKGNEKLKVRDLVLEGRLFGGDKLDAIAKLPTRVEAITQLVTIMQAPISKFVRTMAAPTAQFVRVLAAIRNQKG